ncbi:leucyl/phenylalanyl-tRNA--protein transferase [Hydrogenophaga sp. 5NK40-0174]|uniref:leucyl/phenylalanyl-tRNA--protein transferase n=1 Tax=Hydrogenophaga sp. 5NK40-0174 TaxID=3127649 RepID=UPI0031038C67
MSLAPPSPLPWLEPGQPFPPVDQAWGPNDPAPGLLAAGGVLDVETLISAYSKGIFPWYGEGQPILWWCTDPRMVLDPLEFKLHRSLRKTLRKLLREQRIEIRMNHSFDRVIRHCAQVPRNGQTGTWILPAMVQAYTRLNRAGIAHSVETWIDGELAGGLYCINLAGTIFGESMFAKSPDASKMALAALVAFARTHHLPVIDCQQDTPHLASLGARPISRQDFVRRMRQASHLRSPRWHFDPVYWSKLLPPSTDQA